MLVAGVLVALVGLGFLLGRTVLSHRETTDAARDSGMLADVSQRIQDFRRIKVKDGRKVWELTAKDAQYFEDQGYVLVKQPSVSFYVGDGDSVQVSGDEGRVYLEQGKDLERVDLSGSVVVKMGDYVMQTDRASYERGRDIIVSPGKVRVSGSSFGLEGEVMVVALKEQQVHVVKGVTTTFYSSSPPALPNEHSAAHVPQS